MKRCVVISPFLTLQKKTRRSDGLLAVPSFSFQRPLRTVTMCATLFPSLLALPTCAASGRILSHYCYCFPPCLS